MAEKWDAKIKAVVFDIDNTLVDFWNFKFKCLYAAVDAMKKAGLGISRKKAMKIIKKMNKDLGIEHKFVFQNLLVKIKGKIDYRILAHALIAYRKKREGLIIPYPNAEEVLKKLKKRYKLGIISDAPAIKAWFRLVSIGLDDLFDEVVTINETKRRKPNKLPFNTILKKLKVKPQEVLMVGDSIKRDMAGAKSTGMKTALAVYGRTLKPRKKPKEADYMIRDIKDLLKILR